MWGGYKENFFVFFRYFGFFFLSFLFGKFFRLLNRDVGVFKVNSFFGEVYFFIYLNVYVGVDVDDFVFL